MLAADDAAMRSRAYQTCRDYLLGAWRSVGPDTMLLERIRGGLSNHLYYCALPNGTKPTANEPREVLLRLYGQMHGPDALEHMLAESVIFTLLSERGLGPRLYGVFPGGRLEEYIPARSLHRAELADPELSRQVADRVARVHRLNVPVAKEASWLWSSVEKWQHSSRDFLASSPHDAALVQKLRSLDAFAEVEYVKQLAKQVDSPVVFAHNDLQEGNILLKQDKARRQVALIDFEYCAYNYRGFDIANHFLERVYGYKNEAAPYYTVHTDAYPSRDEQLVFIRAYLAAYHADNKENKDRSSALHKPNRVPGRVSQWVAAAPTEEETLLREVQAMALVSHVFWLLWSIVQGHVSEIQFGYLDYAKVRLEHYLAAKEELERELRAHAG